jgi:hypothetical protein
MSSSKRILSAFSILLLSFFHSAAQPGPGFDGNELQGEFGITAGMAHYFGDLNTRMALNRPKPALGIFYRKQFNNYLALRISAHYAQLGYSDIYSKNIFQERRNLSFNSDIWEFAVHGDFNFFRFQPNNPSYRYTPFLSLGLGVFSYNPYAFLNEEKIFLRPLGTEGQNKGYEGRKPYSSMALCIPIGFGIKYNITDRVNFSVQVSHRLTNTDYLDDVSTTYAGIGNFDRLPNGQLSVAGIMQDRSYEKGTPIGLEGKQRGWSKQRDQFLIAEIGLSFNIVSYKCPSGN